MKRVAIVYWSGSGNTEKMAECIAEGVRESGGEAVLMGPSAFSADQLREYDAVAFGCPAMGNEVLEESEFEPMFSAVEGALTGRTVALFGSYGWGDGQWMRDWCARCDHANLVDDAGLMVNEAPGEGEQEACRALGRRMVQG